MVGAMGCNLGAMAYRSGAFLGQLHAMDGTGTGDGDYHLAQEFPCRGKVEQQAMVAAGTGEPCVYGHDALRSRRPSPVNSLVTVKKFAVGAKIGHWPILHAWRQSMLHGWCNGIPRFLHRYRDTPANTAD